MVNRAYALIIGAVVIAGLVAGAYFAFLGYREWRADDSEDAARTYCEGIVASMPAQPPVLPAYTGQPKVDFDTFPAALAFRTRISEAVAKGPNYAGAYTVATWGCGSLCQRSAIINVETGQIVSFSIPSEFGVEYSLNSRILVVNPKSYFPKLSEMKMSEEEFRQMYSRSAREYHIVLESASMRLGYLEKICTENVLEGVR